MPPKSSFETVSRETREKLEAYHALLVKWQKAINLVSKQSLDDAWERHFEDSMQLKSYIPNDTKTLLDLGSGAGFPGLVLAILWPELDAHLIESNEKKCEFLRAVSRETETEVTIHTARIEGIAQPIKPDIITARALASLEALCGYCLPWAEGNPDVMLLFLKGEKAQAEIGEAQGNFKFDCEVFPSQTLAGASIVKITNLIKA